MLQALCIHLGEDLTVPAGDLLTPQQNVMVAKSFNLLGAAVLVLLITGSLASRCALCRVSARRVSCPPF